MSVPSYVTNSSNFGTHLPRGNAKTLGREVSRRRKANSMDRSTSTYRAVDIDRFLNSARVAYSSGRRSCLESFK
jgi:hypothetical protein